MIKKIPLFLIAFSILFNLFKCANVNEAALSDLTESDEEDRQVIVVSGVKRKFDEVQEVATTGSKSEQELNEERLEMFIEAMTKAITSFKSTPIAQYQDNAAANFFDKLIRRSFLSKLTEDDSSLRLWDMPCSTLFNRKWHIEAYFFILKNNFHFSEEVLVEYFEFVIKEVQESYSTECIVRATCYLAVDKQYLDLFSTAFLMLKGPESPIFGLRLLVVLRARLVPESGFSKVKAMCMLIIQRLPRLSYSPKLRIPEFKGSEMASNLIFIHFLPMYRTLIIPSEQVFNEELEVFDDFSLYNLGDLEKITPMGFGGLAVIDQMFLRSKINVSAFDSADRAELKPKLIERIFDAVLLGLEPDGIVLELAKSGSFSIFESFCKYSTESQFDPKTLQELLLHLIKNCQVYTDSNYILALLAYHEIPQSVWDNLRKVFAEKSRFRKMIELFASIQSAIEGFELKTRIELSASSPSTMELNLSSEVIDEISEIRQQPYQLDVSRVFLARSCGVPLELTPTIDNNCEGFEWREAVGFINFHVERVAALAGYSGEILKFV